MSTSIRVLLQRFRFSISLVSSVDKQDLVELSDSQPGPGGPQGIP